MPELLLLEAPVKENIWGGTGLAEFGYPLPSDTCGEAWVVSAHPHGDARIREGRFAGQTLSQVYRENRALFGPDAPEEFPLLVKIIDAQQDLSIQVHPDDAYAREHENGSLGKSECWLITRAGAYGGIVFGHRAKTREELKEMVTAGRFDELICRRQVAAGDFFDIQPGTVHAICAGTQLVEVQQSSDITYRLYDYGRLQNGRPRPLHLAQALDVIKVPAVYEEQPRRERQEGNALVTVLTEGPYFTVADTEISGLWRASWQTPWACGVVLDGSGMLADHPVKKGDSFVILSPEGLSAAGRMRVLFAGPGGSHL